MNTAPECHGCTIRDIPNLCSFADLVERVYVSDALDSSSRPNIVTAEEGIRQTEITPDTIDGLRAKLADDLQLSLTSCMTVLHGPAQADKKTLANLTFEQAIAIAACATQRLHRTCEL